MTYIFLIKGIGKFCTLKNSAQMALICCLNVVHRQLKVLARLEDQRVPLKRRSFVHPNDAECQLRVLARFVGQRVPLKWRLFVRPNDAYCQLTVLFCRSKIRPN